MGLIYLITSPSKKQYVGQTRGTLEKRIGEHKCFDTRHSRLPIKRAFHKYGSAMKVEVLVELPDNMLNEMERRFIALYDTYNNGYNLTPGGEQSPMTVPEIAARAKATMNTPEVKKKLSDAQKKNHQDPERNKKVSISLKAAHARPETKARYKAGWKLAQSRPEQRAKNSAAQLIAQKNPETNAKRSASLKLANQKDPSINVKRSASLKLANQKDPSINKRRSESMKLFYAKKRAEREAAKVRADVAPGSQ